MKLGLDCFLEHRDVPSSVSFNAGILAVAGDVATPNVITLDPVDANTTRVTLNGTQTFYSGVTSIVVTGGDRNDDLSNNTGISWTVFAGKGGDTILGGGVNDVYNLGAGKDVVYDLLGSNVIWAAMNDAKLDRVFTNVQSVANVGPEDDVVNFFAAGRTPGAGAISLESGVLYIAPPNYGSQTVIDNVGGSLIVTYNFNDGNGLRTFTAPIGNVKYIAYFGGSGNDTYVNNTNISEASYGSAGDDVVIGGIGNFSLLKGSGGNDYLQGRAARNDLSSNGGADVLVVADPFSITTVRTDSLDLVLGIPDLNVMS